MYGVVGGFLCVLYFLKTSLYFELILILIFPTLIEFITGYLYLKIKKTRLWDYSEEFFSLKGIICLKFSFFWFIISAFYYYLVLPLI